MAWFAVSVACIDWCPTCPRNDSDGTSCFANSINHPMQTPGLRYDLFRPPFRPRVHWCVQGDPVSIFSRSPPWDERECHGPGTNHPSPCRMLKRAKGLDFSTGPVLSRLVMTVGMRVSLLYSQLFIVSRFKQLVCSRGCGLDETYTVGMRVECGNISVLGNRLL